MIVCKSLSVYVTAMLANLSVLFSTYNSSPLDSDYPNSRFLLCLCNDNNHCVTNKLSFRHSFFSNGSGSSLSKMGQCKTSKYGRCYTVKEVNIDAIKRSSSKRKRKSVFNESSLLISASPNAYSRVLPSDLSNVTTDIFIRTRFGCLPPDERTTLSCNSHLSNHVTPRAISCCNLSDFCNANNVPKFYHYNSDLDAIKSVLHSINTGRLENRQKRPLYSNLTLNIGPELLIGGKPVHKAFTEAHSEPRDAYELSPLTRILFIVALVVVTAILMVTLTSVFILYKRRVHKRRQILYNSIHWIPNHLKNRKQTHLLRKDVIQINNGVPTTSFESHSQKEKICSQHIPQNGPSSHTTSTDSTRTTNFGNDKQVLLPSLCSDKIQQTVNKQVTLIKLLGRGCFSEVWSGRWHGEPVTAKLFAAHNTLADSVWRRAVLLHRSMLLRHQSVQGLMAIDSISWPPQSPPSVHRVMLVAEWLQFGSLNNLMAKYRWIVDSRSNGPCAQAGQRRSFIDCGPFHLVHVTDNSCNTTGVKPLLTAADTDSLFTILLRMAHSLTQGLCFLHTEFAGTRGKPALAHRDLKPANVLIRSDWTCCLADLGLAVHPLPSNFPMSQVDLHSLYTRYVSQVSLCTHHQSEASPSNLNPLVSVQINSRTLETREETKCDNGSPTGQITLAGVTLVELEQLAWWPIGGIQIGTPRYLAPELLANSIDPFCFTAYQKADVYALGLILWELFAWTLSCWQYQRLDNYSSVSSTVPGAAVTSRGNNYISTSCVSPATNESIIMPISPAFGHDCHCYPPAFQEEWKYYVSTNYNNDDGCDLSAHEIAEIKMERREPDIPTMHHLVCSLRLRPKLPQLFALPICNCKPVGSGHTVEIEKDQGIELVSEGDSGRFRASSRSSAEIADSYPFASSTNYSQHQAGPCYSASYSSSTSSGASSLNHPSPCPSSSNDNVSHKSSCSNRRLAKAVGQLIALLPECWSQNPDARLTALRVRKNLQRIADQLQCDAQRPQPADQIRPTPATPTAVMLQAPNANIQQCSSCSSSTTIKGV